MAASQKLLQRINVFKMEDGMEGSLARIEASESIYKEGKYDGTVHDTSWVIVTSSDDATDEAQGDSKEKTALVAPCNLFCQESEESVPMAVSEASSTLNPTDGRDDEATSPVEPVPTVLFPDDIAVVSAAELQQIDEIVESTYDRIQKLVETKGPNVYDEYGWTPIHYVVHNHRNENEEYLAKTIDANDNTNINSSEIVRYLLDMGVNVNITTLDGDADTPLHKAVLNPDGESMVTQLLAAGADIQLPNELGLTPMDLARLRYVCSPSIFRMLQRHQNNQNTDAKKN
ncbi:ankyrin repeat domain protein [Nitzschia inconspicua]|uniref:Ankyrin repeat domain protein n=1 Tax=Nitzschia inconspicua TaxID=303405 RepID=A0A9K3Q981_9STRA|nr:ankyrin repeat domain protein [Nitzschia inconspicua]